MELTPPKSEAWVDNSKTPNKDVHDVGLCEKSDIDVQEGNTEKPDEEAVTPLEDQLLTLEIDSKDDISGVTLGFYFYLKRY